MAADNEHSDINASAGLEQAEKGKASPPLTILEQEALDEQLRSNDVQTSFFACTATQPSLTSSS